MTFFYSYLPKFRIIDRWHLSPSLYLTFTKDFIFTLIGIFLRFIIIVILLILLRGPNLSFNFSLHFSITSFLAFSFFFLYFIDLLTKATIFTFQILIFIISILDMSLLNHFIFRIPFFCFNIQKFVHLLTFSKSLFFLIFL